MSLIVLIVHAIPHTHIDICKLELVHFDVSLTHKKINYSILARGLMCVLNWLC